MRFQPTSLCAGLIATSILAFSSTSVQAKSQIIPVPVSFDFRTEENLGSCKNLDILTNPTSFCVTGDNNPLNVDNFEIQAFGGLLSSDEYGLGIGENSLIEGTEYLKLNLAKPKNNLTVGGNLNDLILGSLNIGDKLLIKAFGFEDESQPIMSGTFGINKSNSGLFINNASKKQSKIYKKNNSFNLATKFQSSGIKYIVFKPEAGNFQLVAANTLIPEPSSTVGLISLFTGWLLYKGINKLNKRQNPKL